MIHLSGVALARGAKTLLADAELRIHAGERVGVIGQNGCGKSTLFALLRGEIQPDAGTASMPADWRIAAMEQEVVGTERRAIDFVLDGDTEFRALEAAMETAGGEQLGEIHARFAAIDGYRAARAHELLDGLGFATAERERAVREFSGGWRLRLALARTLMCPSDLMLLDEPTNHLDLDALVWLEAWLARYPGTLILISHDRDFLDNVCNRIVAFEGGTLSLYRGNYSAFERQRAEKLASQQQAFQKQQQRIQEIEGFVARFRAQATKARQAQSRPEGTGAHDAHRARARRLAVHAAPALLRARLHAAAQFRARRAGVRRHGHPAKGGARHHAGAAHRPARPERRRQVDADQDDRRRTGAARGPAPHRRAPAHRLLRAAPAGSAGPRGNALPARAAPQPRGERAIDPRLPRRLRLPRRPSAGHRGQFSGGEQARLALALVAWQKPNLLLLDEPTNHLDLEMRHALTMALQEYPGAVLIVSHDRHLLRNTVDEFLLVADGRVEPFDGDLDDYRKLLLDKRAAPAADVAAEEPGARVDRRDERRLAAEKRERLRPWRNRIASLEKDMEKLQAELRALDERLQEPALYEAARAGEVQDLLRRQGALKQELATVEEDWLMACEELEAL